MIVTEIFGDDPLAENVLPTIIHAAEHLLREVSWLSGRYVL
jgi:hypothetical protein